MGNNKQLIVVYSNIECSNSLGSTFDVAVWDSLKVGGLYKRLEEWQVSLCHWLLMSQKLIEFLIHFYDLYYHVIAFFFLCRNMYYLPNLYFAEIYIRNENFSKDQK